MKISPYLPILIAILLTGCVSEPQGQFVVKYLDTWDRRTMDHAPVVDITIDSSGFPIAPKEVVDSIRIRSIKNEFYKNHFNPADTDEDQNKLKAIFKENNLDPEKTIPIDSVRWRIHPNAPLKMVAWELETFRGMESHEFITTHAIYMLGAPNYGGRRLPLRFPGLDVNYCVTPEHDITRNDVPVAKARDNISAARIILDDVDRNHDNLNFVNIYFEFLSSNTWKDVEDAMYSILPDLDSMRGFWLGTGKESKIILHFHDIEKKKWNMWIMWNEQIDSSDSAQPDK